ncbi:MAG TPA: tetratricopeptide repeat protein [Gemmataceae bacterium]|nr:tetratricopeptide repeat protein [Gemmataceae bacterium]
MPQYLLTGRNPEGKTVTERVDTSSADKAVAILRDRGYEDIILHTDDVGARYTNQRAVERHISPKEYVAFRHFRGRHDHAFFIMRKLFRQSIFLLLIAAFWLGFRRWLKIPFGFWDIFAIIIVTMPVVTAVFSQFFSPGAKYRKLIEAASWFRWEEVLRRLPGLRSSGLSEEELAFREAQALAGLGRFEEAMDLVRPFARGRRMPEWLYWARLANLYQATGEIGQVIAVTEKAAELAPENPTVLLDLAAVLLRYQRDTVRAREMLNRALQHAISDAAAPFVVMIKGMLAFEEGKTQQGVELLEESQRQMEKFRHATPIIGAVVDRTHAYLALAYAKLGDKEAAIQHYRLAEPRMRAMMADDLLRRCEMAIGPALSEVEG